MEDNAYGQSVTHLSRSLVRGMSRALKNGSLVRPRAVAAAEGEPPRPGLLPAAAVQPIPFVQLGAVALHAGDQRSPWVAGERSPEKVGGEGRACSKGADGAP